ncbi:MAG: hypothetical protein E7012_04580 [Alphaproteobacteria bacterium]|nr:hypothetical protein [Alphaproteobacteria bacterium]
MVEKNIEEKQQKSGKLKKTVRLFLVMIVLGAGCIGVWKNPQWIEKIKDLFDNKPKVDVYQQQIDVLTRQISVMNNQMKKFQQKTNMALSELNIPDLSPLYEKIAMIEKMNMNVIDSKADVATVLGVVSRMDKAEHKLDKLSAVTNDSALTLTAVMLVKDKAEQGGNFEYEAGVLKQIVADNPNLKKYAEEMEVIAKKGIVSELSLIKSFDEIYLSVLAMQKENFSKNWKERISDKLNEFVKIKKTNVIEPEFKEDKDWENIKNLVDGGKLYEAAEAIKSLEKAKLPDDASIIKWIDNVNNRLEFYALINALSAQSLATMKVNFLKNIN